MNGMSSVAVTARLVRAASATVVLALILGVMAISSFSARYGSGAASGVAAAGSDRTLTAAVAEQESAGLVCSTHPAATSVVLFQPARTSRVSVLRFDTAVKAVSARQGTIRRYCA